MKKRIRIIILALMLAVCFAGCGKNGKNGADQEAEEISGSNTVEIKKDGSIVNTIEESFDETLYEKEQLEEFMLKKAAQYNHENGDGALSIKKMEVSGGSASVTMEYRTWEDFSGFNEYPFFCGTIEEALREGYDFAGVSLQEAASAGGEEGLSVQKDEILEMGSRKILITRVPEDETLFVKTSGKILYISGAEYEKKNLAAIEGRADVPAYIVFK